MIVKLSLLRVYPRRRAVELAAIFRTAALGSLPAYCDTPSYYDFSPSSVSTVRKTTAGVTPMHWEERD